ncbi:MAG: c-type cytochrome [Alphaproteobacteria bacterium]
MNAGFFENLLLSIIVTVIIFGVSYIAGEALIQPTGGTAPVVAVVEPTPEKPAAAAEVTVVAEAVSLASLLATADKKADLNAGKKLYGKCKSCHTVDEGGKNRVGPNLWNIVGRAKASGDGYKYSAAMADLGGDWNFANLDGFLAKPKAFVKGTKMSYSGMRKATDRAALIVWLRSMSDNPVALP